MADSEEQFLQQLQNLSRSLSRGPAPRRGASLVLPRSSNATAVDVVDGPRLVPGVVARSDHRSQSSRHAFVSPWHSFRKTAPHRRRGEDDDAPADGICHHGSGDQKRGGIWAWKPMRALAHLAMHRLVCIFSVEVVTVQHLPPSANGLRLAIAVRKKESRDGAAQTMPSRVLQGLAEFKEILFVRCHLYCIGGAGTGKPLRFEPRLFLISTVAVDAPQLDLGASIVDLSALVKESVEKNLEGQRIRQWDVVFPLSGKAKGGEMVLKLGFQIMEDGSNGIYKQPELTRSNKGKLFDFSTSGKQHHKSSLSTSSRRIMQGDPALHKAYQELNEQDLDVPEFEVISKGIEIEEARAKEDEAATEHAAGRTSVSSEVVKEVVHARAQRSRLKELGLFVREIKGLDLITMEDAIAAVKATQPHKNQNLDAKEEIVTREFLQMLEIEDSEKSNYDDIDLVSSSNLGERDDDEDEETDVLIPDLGKNLGCVVQTKDGGYLASMNPFDVRVPRNEAPKLVMQISKELILQNETLVSGFEVFQRLAAMGAEEMGLKLLSLAAMDELIGKTAGQVAFEGIASAVISGRNKEGASSSVARSISMVKNMAAAMSKGRKDSILTRLWSVNEEPVTLREILTSSLQKMESMAVDALKVQAEMNEEEAPFETSPLKENADSGNPLDSAIVLDEYSRSCSPNGIVTMLVVIQLRNPARSYESVGAPIVAVVQAAALDGDAQVDEERRFRLTSLHVGGLKLSTSSKRSAWDGEMQRLTAMQWLVENGLGKASGRRRNQIQARRIQDLVWSISSRFTAGTWLKHVRNPNVKAPGCSL